MNGLQNPSIVELVGWPAFADRPPGTRFREQMSWSAGVCRWDGFSEGLECLTVFCRVDVLTELSVP